MTESLVVVVVVVVFWVNFIRILLLMVSQILTVEYEIGPFYTVSALMFNLEMIFVENHAIFWSFVLYK